jgi:hypothetical protein
LDQGGWRRSVESIVEPPPHLAGFIESCWIDDWAIARPAAGAFRIVADGSPHIIWTVSAGRHTTQTINIVGARRVKHDILVSRRRFTVGLRLRPGALRALLAKPASLFTDRSIPLPSSADLRANSTDAALRQLLSAVERLTEHASPLDWRAELDETPSEFVGRADSFKRSTPRGR